MPRNAAKEKHCMLKIRNIEKNIVKLLDKVYSSKDISNRAEIDFNETRRRKFQEGYYLFTIQEAGNESHGIVIEKRLTSTGKERFYLFDPNGQKWANTSAYHIMISHSRKLHKPIISLSPKKSWNPMGYCGLWCIVMVIFFNSIKEEPDDVRPFVASDTKKLYKYMNKHGSAFIKEIYTNLIEKSRKNYTTQSETMLFIEAVLERLIVILHI